MRNKLEVIKKYKGKPHHKSLLKLSDGNTVIGEEVDEDNKLFYVFRVADDIVVERANKYRISSVLREPASESHINNSHNRKVVGVKGN